MPAFFEKILRPLLRGLFHPASRFPADPRAIFLLGLSVFVGMTALILDAAPATLNSVLPHWAVIIWGALLTAGSVVTLAGMTRQTVGGIIAEQIGSVTVGATTVFYAAVGLKVSGIDVLQPVGIVLAWGLSCFIRWIQLQLLLLDAHQLKVEDAVESEVRRRLDEES